MTDKALSNTRRNTGKEVFITFIVCFLIAFIAIIPFVIRADGLFTLSYDFNAQELPFNIFANREIKAGNVFFNWAIEIGSDFLNSFSFYNLGSPFFWFTLLFSPDAFPYLVAWVFMLKYAVAGMNAYLYLKRYLPAFRYALIGAIFYAFSGFQAGNMVFYHFHDAVAFFPLLLVGIDEAVENRKWWIMAAAVGINAMVNWNFFFGEVIFAIIYYVIRYDMVRRIRNHEGKAVSLEIGHCISEGLMGGGIAAVILIPSFIFMLGNSRISNHLSGIRLLLYPLEEYVQMFRALFFPGEPLAYYSALSVANWYSINAYLPLVGVIPVIAFLIHTPEKLKWVRTLLITSCVIALVPILNSVFVLFNIEPYRRWYYMPVLIMSLAASEVLARIPENAELRKTIKRCNFVSLILIAVMILFLCTTSYTTLQGGVGINQKHQFVIYTSAGVLGIIVLYIVASWLYGKDRKNHILTAGIAVFAVFNIFFNVYIDQSKNDHMSSSQEVYASVVQSVQDLDPDVLPYRYHFWNAYYNRNLCKSLPATNAFMSVVDNGIFDFYETIQSPRHTGTPTRPPGISALLSVKYYVRGNTVRTGSNSESAVPSQKVYVRDVGERCVPIGFAYDSYLLKSEYETIEDYSILGYVMMRTMVIRDEDESFVSQLLPHFDLKHAEEFDQEHLKEDIASRRRYSSSKFEANTTSFTSDIEVPEARFAFFSVPYSNRWSATVNGETVQILDANGLMAVPLSAGKNHVVFRYDIRINIISMVISLAFLIAEIILLMRNRLVHLHNPDKKHEAEAVM